jgi:Ca2+:H+ antiporter
MLRRMSEKALEFQQAKNAQRLSGAIRAEFPLLIGLVTVAIFFAAGSQLVEIIAHPARLIGVFIWLFAVILWSAMCVVRHA